MARALKVFRTSTGFHDAYVAAASRAAALRAWGSEHDLFARGAAEEITDPVLMAEPLAKPGEVIRRSRGSLAEQLAALPGDPPRTKHARQTVADDDVQQVSVPRRRSTRSVKDTTAGKSASKNKPRPKPRPSRAKLDDAEAAIDALDADYKAAFDGLAAREAVLRAERRALEEKWERAQTKAQSTLERIRAGYDEALERWRRDE